MHKLTTLTLGIILLMTLTGCFKGTDKDPVVAIVNGEKIYKSNLLEFVPPQARDQDISPYFEQLRERAVHVELALKKAVEEVKPDDAELQAKLGEVRDDVLLDRYRHQLKDEHANDKKLQEHYEKFKAENPSETEMRARHILVETEDQAKEALKKIEEGADFGKLATEISKDKGAKGGDLGFFRASDMVKPFSEKAFALRTSMAKRVGTEDFTHEQGDRGIVQTDFGWHVIEVLGSRSSSHPPFDEMRENLVDKIMKEAVDEVAAKLRKTKDIKMFNLDGTPYKEGYKLEDLSQVKPDQVLVQIDGQGYGEKDLRTMLSNPKADIRPFYDKLLQEFIKKKLLEEEARKAISLTDPEVKKELDIITHRLIVNLYLEREVKKRLKDEDLQKAYQDDLKTHPPVDEVHARHILVESENDAKAIKKQLEEGADFGELALAKSKDKASGTGDLGFFRKEDMVPEFSEMAFSLPPTQGGKAQYGLAKSTFGWHIIEVLEKRQSKQPAFEEVKERLQNEASQKIVDGLLTELRQAAKVELFDLPDIKKDKKA